MRNRPSTTFAGMTIVIRRLAIRALGSLGAEQFIPYVARIVRTNFAAHTYRSNGTVCSP